MSEEDTKNIHINVKELSYKGEQNVTDLMRYLTEALPQIEVSRSGNEIEVVSPNKLSKRAVRLRIRKFLHKKNLYNEFRPISFKDAEKDGYIVKEKKSLELAYY